MSYIKVKIRSSDFNGDVRLEWFNITYKTMCIGKQIIMISNESYEVKFE